jgi:transposase-like protein
MTTERRHRRHPTELKLRLVEAYLNGEGSLKSIARAHDITHTLLMIWVDKFRRGELTDEIDYVERTREAEAKIAALERKVGQLTMELDVLKKIRQGASVNGEKVSIISGPLASPSSKDAAS